MYKIDSYFFDEVLIKIIISTFYKSRKEVSNVFSQGEVDGLGVEAIEAVQYQGHVQDHDLDRRNVVDEREVIQEIEFEEENPEV